ncbi:MAG: putative metal-binding motif-containing protein, partial [Nitrospirae bacterium]|nr:putative metal-binding motif-containing protein [Nitrospirota bacterium]
MFKYRSIFIILFSVLVLALSFVPVHAACTDNDSDGYGSPGDISCPKGKLTDCNDNDNKVYPGAPKICDGKDNNCDGRLD